LYILPVTTSTNDIVKGLAQSGAPEGTVVVAEQQTRGRGRYGRTFASPAGVGIYLSLLVRPQVETVRLPPLTLAVAVATAEALVQYCALPVHLKWPNDVEIHGKKVAGILTEAVLGAGVSPVAIIGIGINVNTTLEHLPPELHQHVTSLALASGHAWPRLPLMAVLLAHLERLYQTFQGGDVRSIVQRWLHYGQIIGRQVRFTHDASAGTGTVVGLAVDGALLVRNSAGMQQRLVAGEVTFI
jgi:BirA family biotin operon repressor/biotin-[acetyl-CoA-carboxylase] ligase